ncbi:MAG: DUF3108 domain-containing protein [Hyphomonadaceae bacterium]|nr:DUF3108 domain-containing protein [Hyphomonadaceae bacterium]
MLKKIIGNILLGTTLLSSPVWAQASENTEMPFTPAPSQEVTEVEVFLKGYVFGLRIAKVKYKTGFTDDAYYSLASMKTSGLGAFLKKWAIWSISTGRFNGMDILPTTHLQQNLNKKNRRVEMTYGADKVDVSIVPPLGSQGVPPATAKQRFESDDTLSVLLKLTMGGFKTSEKVCDGTVPVFDSKQHYNLRMERDGEKYIKQKGFKGDTIRCKIYYDAISGYDPEDLPSEEEAATPVTVYLSRNDDIGMYIPVKMVYKISGFSAVIKTRDIKITKRTVNKLDFKGLGFAEQETRLKRINFLAKD